MKKLVEDPQTARSNRQLGNEGSYMLHLKVGSFDGVFLGDAPLGRSQGVKWRSRLAETGVQLLKVAHHGARDGTSPDLLAQLSGISHARGVKKAIIAPFGSHRLPRQEVIKWLMTAGFDVTVTGGKERRDRKGIAEIERATGTLAGTKVSGYRTVSSAFAVERFALG